MATFPDKSGYTDNGMPLSAANDEDLAQALQLDAKEHGIPATVNCLPYDPSLLEQHLRKNLPVLLTCTVRLPHKPELS